MRIQTCTAAAVIFAFLVAGCEKEATYQGKTVSAWITLADDADLDTQWAAYDALSQLKSKSPKARQKLLDEYRRPRNDCTTLEIGLKLWPDESKSTLALGEKVLRSQADEGSVFCLQAIESLVWLAGADGGVLKDDLDYAISKAKKRGDDYELGELKRVAKQAGKPLPS